MLVGFGWMGQAHMQQMAATGVARTAPGILDSSSIGVAVSGAAGGMAGFWSWMGWDGGIG